MPGDDPGRGEGLARWEWIGLALCGAAFVLLRLPLYRSPGVILGWHSDAALLGLMARSIAEGDIPLLFWGADYLAPLTSLFAAGAGVVLHEVGPLALRLGVAVEVFAALVFFHVGLRRVAGSRAALLTTFWLTAGPPFFFKLTYAPLSAEQYFFIGAILFWYTVRAPFDRPHRWLVLGLLTGAGWWIHRGALFVAVPALAIIAVYDRRRLRPWQLASGLAIFAAGTLLGDVPAMIGRYAIDQRLYTPVQRPWSVDGLLERFRETATGDFWLLLGAETRPLGWMAGALFIALLASAAWHFERRRETVFAAGILAITAAFWILSTDAYKGAVRYVMIAVPILCAFAARELVRMWDARRTSRRTAAVLAALVIAAAYFVPARHQVHEVTMARREVFENWGGFDPRPALRNLSTRGYRVCYADVWVAHKLEWLSKPTVRFIPYHSVDRRMVESLRLAGTPGAKCFVDKAGNVYTLTPREQAQFRLETLRRMRP